METTRVLIVGAGPIGLEVHALLKRSGVPVVHLEAECLGATMHWWAPGTRFFSSPDRLALAGVPLPLIAQDKPTREEYLAYLRAFARQMELDVRTFERVSAIEPRGQGKEFLVRSRRRAGEPRLYAAERVVLAIGDMHRPRLVGIPGEDLPHVSHYLRDPHQYVGRRVLIVGGKNSAVEAAIRCRRIDARVALSYRRADFDPQRVKYWLLPELRGLIRSRQIEFHPETVPTHITATHVRLTHVRTGAAFDIPADDVLLLTGYEMDASLLESAGVELRGASRAPTFNPRTMETNVPGLYVAGTATAGTQRRHRVFIENCHAHASRIAAHIAGVALPEPQAPALPPET